MPVCLLAGTAPYRVLAGTVLVGIHYTYFIRVFN